MQILVVMDPIERVNPEKDTTFGFMLSAGRRGHDLYYCLAEDLYMDPAIGACARARPVEVREAEDFYTAGAPEDKPLGDFQTVWMRTDPPVDWIYLHATYVLDHAPASTLVVNRPSALRSANEKLYALNWPELCPRTMVTRDSDRITAWLEGEGEPLIVKPLDGHGGAGIFLLTPGDRNVPSIIETLTQEGQRWIIAQEYLPAAREGDKRILLIEGQPVGAIMRVPTESDHRGNMHVGGSALSAEITAEDEALCRTLAPKLAEDGLYFVGLDVIGGKLTEVNVTSPTGIREVLKYGGPDVGDLYVEMCERKA